MNNAHYYQRNRARILERAAQRRRRDPDAARAYEREVYKRRRARAIAANRARERTMGSPTAETVAYEAVLRQDPCAYCGGPGGQVDHIQPVASGGENHWSNETAACPRCNRSKEVRTMLEALLA